MRGSSWRYACFVLAILMSATACRAQPQTTVITSADADEESRPQHSSTDGIAATDGDTVFLAGTETSVVSRDIYDHAAPEILAFTVEVPVGVPEPTEDPRPAEAATPRPQPKPTQEPIPKPLPTPLPAPPVTPTPAATPTPAVTPIPAAVPTPAAVSPSALTGLRQSGGIDFTLTRRDIECGAGAMPSFAGPKIVAARVVVDANLGALCFGESDERLTEAWRILAAIAPEQMLDSIAVFLGFTQEGGPGEPVLYGSVSTLSASPTIYQMSVNLAGTESDTTLLRLTIAHELGHMLTLRPDEYSLLTQKHCNRANGYFDGYVCFNSDSLVKLWVDRFWGNGLLNEIDPTYQPMPLDGAERCRTDPSFLGPYPASNPEEDLAETFAVFVYRMKVRSPELQAKIDWLGQFPELREVRALVDSAGFGRLEYPFETCG